MNFRLKLISLIITASFFGLLLPKLTPVLASTLSLNPQYTNVEQGKDLVVDVVLTGKGELIDGCDAVVTYDPNFLSVKDVKQGTFFANYPLKNDDGQGKLQITALAPQDGIKISGGKVIATVTFEIMDSGQTQVGLAFTSGSTSDSNVPLHKTSADSLTAATGGSYNVVATPENLKKSAARKAGGGPSPLLVFIPLLILIGFGVWYWWKHRKPKEDVYVPEPFPMDQPPTDQTPPTSG